MKQVKYTIVSVFVAAMFSGNTFAQSSASIIGYVVDAQTSMPVEFATISLLAAEDSTVLSGTITDSTGKFLLENITPGNYITKISCIGYSDLYKEASVEGGTLELGVMNLQTSENALETVEIVGTRKVVETIPGGIVYNADQVLANANKTTFDMLKGVPNIIVDKDEHISIRGNTGINVMLDGVPLNMSGDDLTNFLKQVPANMITSVEVITTPGAKYDAAGSGGIINLKTKQNKASGNSGTITTGVESLGSWNAGANMFSNSEKFRLRANYHFNHSYFESIADGTRENFLNPEPLYYYDETFLQSGETDNHFGKFGLDYIANEKNTIGASISYGRDKGSFLIEDLLYTQYPDAIVSGGYNASLTYNYTGDNYSGNLHYNKKFNKEGSELNTDVNYSHYSHNNTIPATADFFDSAGSIIDGSSTERLDATDFGVNIITAKLDYVLPLKESSKLEAGLKLTNTQTENNLHAEMVDLTLGEWVNDTSVSNDFLYTESVFAGYLSYDGALKKLNYTLGLRSEYTQINTASATTGLMHDAKYIDLFPSANLKYALPKGGELSLDYSRRIERPVYQWLNPFIDKSTPYTWFTGNPDLQPYYTNAFALNYTKFIQMKHYLMAGVFYQSMKDIFTQYFEYAGGGVYYLTMNNINNQTTIGTNLMVQSTVTKWLDVLVNISAYQNRVDNTLSGIDLEDKISANLYTTTTCKFWQNAALQLTFNGMSPSTNAQGYFEGYYTIDAGIKKSFLNDQLTVSATVKDIFNTMDFTNEFVDEAFLSTYRFKPLSRTAGISLSWRFGDVMKNLLPDEKSDEERRVQFGSRNG
jgi:outer membrane receptor protein involved in Fe transport